MFGASTPDPYIFAELPGYNPGNRNLTGKAQRSPRPETVGVLICAGQSNICNTIDTAYFPINAAKIDNLNVYSGGLYAGADPLLGCSNMSSRVGNTMTRLADKLITAGKYGRVILVTVGMGSTTVGMWASSLYPRIVVAHRRCLAVGLTPSAVLWHQGENDTTAGTSEASYQASLSSIISTVRAAGVSAKWVVAQASYIGGVTSSAVLAAQAAVVDGSTIFAGPNTDVVGSAGRVDNTHFNSSGADTVAGLWTAAIAGAL